MRITSEFVLTLLKNKDKTKFMNKVETFMDLKVNYQILKHINNPLWTIPVPDVYVVFPGMSTLEYTEIIQILGLHNLLLRST